MVTRNLSIGLETGQIVTHIATPIFVKRPSDVAPALRQHERPVVIDNDQISAKFRRLGYWDSNRQIFLVGWIATLVVALLAFAISQQYGVDSGWKAKWNQGEFEGRLKLTPKP